MYIRLLILSVLFSFTICANAIGNNTFLNDSVFYSDQIYYQIIPDKNNNDDISLAVIGWDPEIIDLDIPESAIIPEREEGPLNINKSNVKPRNWTVHTITYFYPKPRLFALTMDQYKVQKIKFSMDIEFAPDINFSEFKYLSSLDLPLNMKEIPARTFKNCSFIKSINIKKNIEKIGEEAFAGCSSLEEVNFEYNSDLKYISDRAFADCTKLISVNMEPAGRLWQIGSGAFENCTSLESVKFNRSIDYICYNAFDGCTSLKKFDINNTYEQICDMGGGLYQHNGILYYAAHASNFHECFVYLVPPAISGSITFDINATYIRERAFENRTEITSVYITDNFEKIETMAFKGCTGLKKLRLSGRLETIADSCFIDCSSLENLELPVSIINIGKGAFSGCSSLSTVTIPMNVASIGVGAFANCKNLKSFNVDEWNSNFVTYDEALYKFLNGTSSGKPYTAWWLIACPADKNKIALKEDVDFLTIEAYSFAGCRNITEISITNIPNISIDPTAFWGCDNLMNFYVDQSNQPYEQYGSYDGILTNTNHTTIIAFPGGRTTAEFKPLADGGDITKIGKNAFYGNSNITTLTFNRVYYVESPNFIDCDNISEINILELIPKSSYNGDFSTDFFTDKVYENAILNIKYPFYDRDNEEYQEYYANLELEIREEIANSAIWSKFKNVNFDFSPSAIDEIENEESDSPVVIYDINGNKINAININTLNPGIYIILNGKKTSKIIVK